MSTQCGGENYISREAICSLPITPPLERTPKGASDSGPRACPGSRGPLMLAPLKNPREFGGPGGWGDALGGAPPPYRGYPAPAGITGPPGGTPPRLQREEGGGGGISKPRDAAMPGRGGAPGPGPLAQNDVPAGRPRERKEARLVSQDENEGGHPEEGCFLRAVVFWVARFRHRHSPPLGGPPPPLLSMSVSRRLCP